MTRTGPCMISALIFLLAFFLSLFIYLFIYVSFVKPTRIRLYKRTISPVCLLACRRAYHNASFYLRDSPASHVDAGPPRVLQPEEAKIPPRSTSLLYVFFFLLSSVSVPPYFLAVPLALLETSITGRRTRAFTGGPQTSCPHFTHV